MTPAICFLGVPRLVQNGKTSELPRERPLWLLAYLGAQEDWVSRGELSELFWPGLEESSARNNLRQLLHRARKLEWVTELEAEPEGVRWRAETDLRRFRQALGKGDWAEAVRLYQGDFLEGVRLYDLPDLENWLEAERENLQAAWREAALHRAADLERGEDFQHALPLLERVLQTDPYGEAALQAYLRLSARARATQPALQAYEDFRLRLRREMGLEPDPATQSLAAALLAAEPTLATPASPSGSPHNLPARLTAFMGREDELAQIARQLGDPACRLLTLTGPGGIGKTRLALEAAEAYFRGENQAAQLGSVAQGVFFVPLAPVDQASSIPAAIAQTLGLTLTPREEPLSQLLAHLRDRAMLLVLDNLEHLMEGVGMVQEILQQAPRVKVLATSRERLGLQAEWVMTLEGLPGPEKPGLEAARHSSAVKLFVERASRVQPGFALTPEVAPAVVRVAQLTQGWPLGLELAAAWVQAFEPQAIAQEIEQNLDFLQAPERDRPERHHSMRAVFDHSWRLLSAEEQAVLRCLAVFRGGFERAAAGQVAQASPRVLLALVSKSLVRRTPTGRFELLEVIRQYALEKLEADQAESEAAHARHATHYLSLAEAAEPELHGPEQARWLERLATEHDNLRAALAWVLERREAEKALRLTTALHWFWYVRGYSLEGRDWLEQALSLAEMSVPPRSGDERVAPSLKAKALDALAEKHKDLGNYALALRYQEEALRLWQSLGDRQRVAGALHTLGLVAREQGDYNQALAYFEESLALKRELDDRLGMGATLNDIGVLHSYAGRTAEAVPYFEESLALKRQVGDHLGVAYALGNLSNVFAALGQKEKAQSLLEESLALKRELGDQQGIAVSLYNLALGALEAGEFAQAEPYMREGFQIFHTLGRRWHLAFMLTLFIDYTLRLEQYERAARLIGALYGLAAALGLPEPPGNPSLLAGQIEKTRQALGVEAYQRAVAEGKSMSLEQTLAYTLEDSPYRLQGSDPSR